MYRRGLLLSSRSARRCCPGERCDGKNSQPKQLCRARMKPPARISSPSALEEGRGANQQSEAPDDPTPRVAWHIERGNGAQYVLRNVGRDVAEHVYADQ